MGRVRSAALAALLLALSVCAGSCGGGDGSSGPTRATVPRLATEVVQLRRDEVLGRVEIQVTNRSAEQVVVRSLELRVPGFTGGGPQPKGEPMPPGRVVNLPTPYGEVRCPVGDAAVERPRVVLRVTTASDPSVRRVVLRPRDPQQLLQRIATATCLTERLQREVSLSFAPGWRPSGSGEARVLYGTLRARLTTDQPRDVTQVAGTVMFDLKPRAGPAAPQPLAHLTPASPDAAIPVVVSVARCDGHARGEIKKPFAFLVWIGPPGGDQRAVTPAVTDADGTRFRQLCPF